MHRASRALVAPCVGPLLRRLQPCRQPSLPITRAEVVGHTSSLCLLHVSVTCLWRVQASGTPGGGMQEGTAPFGSEVVHREDGPWRCGQPATTHAEGGERDPATSSRTAAEAASRRRRWTMLREANARRFREPYVPSQHLCSSPRHVCGGCHVGACSMRCCSWRCHRRHAKDRSCTYWCWL